MTAGATGPGGTIGRDQHGIPHLVGPDLDALAYLQGVVTARDRAWQIEVERRRLEGTLAELIGPDGLEWDRFARRSRLAHTARRAYAGLDSGTRGWVSSYVHGVNAALPEGAAQAPEFDAVGGGAGSWQPWTPLGVFLVQHVLFGTFPHKLWRDHVTRTLGTEAGDLLGLEPPVTSGSNAWAVAGSRSVDGGALLVADPHRLIEAPGIYQQVRLACPGLDVLGLAFPGVPGVQHFGHTGGVAWVVTNAMADYQDLYREDLRREGDLVLAREHSGWSPAFRAVETIGVRGGPDQSVEVLETLRGPVVTGAPGADPLSLRTPSRVLGDLGFGALPLLLRARTCDDVAEALAGWVEPVNSVLSADTRGQVRRSVAGRVPRRDPAGRRGPLLGARAEHAWHGWEPLPDSVVDDIAVAANERRPGDTAELGLDFAPPDRGLRITAALAALRAVSVPDCAALQCDTRLAAAEPLLRLLGTALADLPCPDPAGALRDRLLAWDRRMDAGSTDAALFAEWRSALVGRLAADPGLAELHAPQSLPAIFQPWLHVPARVGLALTALVEHGDRLGLDLAGCARAAADDVVRARQPAATSAAMTTTGTVGQSWGERHRLAAIHVLAGRPGDPGVPAVALGGDTGCVLATASIPGVTDACVRGPVARIVWSLADRSASRWVVPLGADGRWNRPHALDQLPVWSAGELLAVPAGPLPADLVETVAIPEAPRRAEPAAAAVDVVRRPVEGLGELTLTTFRPEQDAATVHPWLVQERARFWGMTDHTVDDVRDIYAFVDSLATHHAFLIRIDDRPVGLFQTYQPEHDPVAEAYPVQPGDVGIHVLLAPPTAPVPGFSRRLMLALGRHLFDDLGHQRVVAEPDARNDASLRRMRSSGFEAGDEVDLPGKRARMIYLHRDRLGQESGG